MGVRGGGKGRARSGGAARGTRSGSGDSDSGGDGGGRGRRGKAAARLGRDQQQQRAPVTAVSVGMAAASALALIAFVVFATLRGAPEAASAEGATAATSHHMLATKVDGTAVVVPRLYAHSVVASYPHDHGCFSQGLTFAPAEAKPAAANGAVLYESCGMYRRSQVRAVDLKSGEVLVSAANDDHDFGEGLALAPGDPSSIGVKNSSGGGAEAGGNAWTVYQLLWHTNMVKTYTAATLQPGPLVYTSMPGDRKQPNGLPVPGGDGWGLAFDGTHLIGSDATSTLYFYEPRTMAEVRRVTVQDEGQPVKWLNELEVIHGEVWANIWQRDCIARIDPASGAVTGWVLLTGLEADAAAHMPKDTNVRMDVLNGIAFDSWGNETIDGGRIFVTGKQWPRLYEITVQELGWPGQMDLATVRKHCIIPEHMRTP